MLRGTDEAAVSSAVRLRAALGLAAVPRDPGAICAEGSAHVRHRCRPVDEYQAREFDKLFERVWDLEDDELFVVALTTMLIAIENEHEIGPQLNCLLALKAALTVILRRFAPEQFGRAVATIYPDDDEKGGNDPSGACVIRREGKRGAVFYVKFRDAAGVQVKQRLGRETDGWNAKKAERELGKRLDVVERERWRKPDGLTFATFAERFVTDYLPGRNLKHSSVVNYTLDVRRHLTRFLGKRTLVDLEADPGILDAYIAAKTAEGLSPKTIGNHLTTLSVMFKVAIRWRLVRTNPVALVDRPRVENPEMNVLSEAEIARLLAAYAELEGEAGDAERPLVASHAPSRRRRARNGSLRRGELLALTWGDVKLLERLLTVRRSFVRGRMETPKSRSSRRTIELGPRRVLFPGAAAKGESRIFAELGGTKSGTN